MTLPARSMEEAHPSGALLLHEGRGGDAAQLQVSFVDPLFLAREPLETLADAAVVSQLPDIESSRRVCRHAVQPV